METNEIKDNPISDQDWASLSFTAVKLGVLKDLNGEYKEDLLNIATKNPRVWSIIVEADALRCYIAKGNKVI